MAYASCCAVFDTVPLFHLFTKRDLANSSLKSFPRALRFDAKTAMRRQSTSIILGSMNDTVPLSLETYFDLPKLLREQIPWTFCASCRRVISPRPIPHQAALLHLSKVVNERSSLILFSELRKNILKRFMMTWNPLKLDLELLYPLWKKIQRSREEPFVNVHGKPEPPATDTR